MTVVIDRRDPETDELRRGVARVDGGTVTEGQDFLADFLGDTVPSDADLLDRFRGPTVFARRPTDDEQGQGQGQGQGRTTAARQGSVLDDVPIFNDGRPGLDKSDLVAWVAWVRAGRPDVDGQDGSGGDRTATARSFNPALHPRGPDGKFVERPWDIPDSLDTDNLRGTPTADLLDELNRAGEPIDDVLADDDLKVDGIPDDVNSVAEAKERMGGDGLAFQDLETGDHVAIRPPDNINQTPGQVVSTEQVDGGPNQVTLADQYGVIDTVPVADGTSITRDAGPVLPPQAATDETKLLTAQDAAVGKPVSIVTGIEQEDPTHKVTGTIDDIDGDEVTVDGDTYLPKHENVAMYDATPEELAPEDVSEGDQVAAWTAGTKITEGEVTDKEQIGSSNYITVTDDDGVKTDVNADTGTLTAPVAIGQDQAEQAVDDPDSTAINLDADDVSPDLIAPDDFDDSDLSDPVDPADLSTDTWVVAEADDIGQVAGKVSQTSSTGWADIDTGGSTSKTIFDFENGQARGISDSAVVQAASDNLGDEVIPEQIDPASVSASALSADDTEDVKSYEAIDLEGGTWVTYQDDSGVHAGILDQDVTGDTTLQVNTGADNDPQSVSATDDIEKIDGDVVMDVGDVGGVDSTTTDAPPDPEPDTTVEDVVTNPNTDAADVAVTDLKSPVTEDVDGEVGILNDQQAASLRTQLDNEGLLTATASTDTEHRPGELAMTFPQADSKQVRDNITTWLNNHPNIDAAGTDASYHKLRTNIREWKGSSYKDEAQYIEKAFHSAHNLPGKLRNDGLDGDDPTGDEVAVASALTATSQAFIEQNQGKFETVEAFGETAGDEELPLYRGPGSNAVASMVRDWSEDPSEDDITVEASKMGNFTTDIGIGDKWSSGGVVLKENARPEDVVYSPDAVDAGGGIDDEAEIWLTGGVDSTSRENIQIENQGTQGDPDSDRRTLADLPNDPAEMTESDLELIGNWAELMNNKQGKGRVEYSLQTESQIETFRQVHDRMTSDDIDKGFMGADLSKDKPEAVQDLIERSENILDPNTGGGVPAEVQATSDSAANTDT